MAGAAITVPMQIKNPANYFGGNFLINNGDIINEGDLVGLTSGGYVTPASKTQGAIVKPIGVAVFIDNNGTGGARTGDGSTVHCAIAKKCTLLNATSTLVPSLGAGLPVYLGAVPTATVSNYTCALTSTNGDAIVQVGDVSADGTTIHLFVDSLDGLKYQTAGNSIVNVA